jgi:hypothetical protein
LTLPCQKLFLPATVTSIAYGIHAIALCAKAALHIATAFWLQCVLLFSFFSLMRRALSSFSLTLLLVLLFLLTQTGRAAHEFTHLDGEGDGVETEVCALCLAAAPLDAAAPLPVLPDLSLLAAWVAAGVFSAVACVISFCWAYWGRAPPHQAVCA